MKVIPRSRKSEVAGFTPDGMLKVKVRAAPDKGKANEEVCELLAQHFGVSKRNVEILSGETTQQKRVRIVKQST